jgi:hypothetical protein
MPNTDAPPAHVDNEAATPVPHRLPTNLGIVVWERGRDTLPELERA